MMYGWDGGMSTIGWIFMTLFWVLLIVAIVWAIARLLPAQRETRESGGQAPPEPPETILARRLARGEIDTETYDSLREKLRERDRTPAGVS